MFVEELQAPDVYGGSPERRQLESCTRQSFYFYVNIVARRLEQVPAGNLSEEHSNMQSRNVSFICREL